MNPGGDTVDQQPYENSDRGPFPSIAFVITRMNWYRLLGAAIHAALRQGWRVECWHDISLPCDNRHQDQPTLARLPSVFAGHVTVRQFHGRDGFFDLMRENGVDVVVDIIPLLDCRNRGLPAPPNRPYFVCLEGNMDWSYHFTDEEEVKQTDLFAVTKPYWFEEAIRVMKEVPRIPYGAEIESIIRRKALAVGWPQFDQFSSIDSAAVRKKWDIPAGKPVVLYLNWVDTSAVNLRLAMFPATTARSRLVALRRYRRDWREWLNRYFEPNLGHVTRAIRAFCDRNNALLVIKGRHRDPLWPAEARVADRVIFDEAYFPHTVMEAMSISSLCFGFFSFSVREAIGCSVPYVALDVAGLVDYRSFGETGEPFYRRFAREGGFFHYPGVVSLLSTERILKELITCDLEDFAMRHKARDAYFETYLGYRGRANADIFLDAVRHLCATGSPAGWHGLSAKGDV